MSYHPILKYFLDLLIWSAAGFIAFRIRLPDLLHDSFGSTFAYTLGAVPVRIFLVGAFGLFRQSWARVGVRDLILIGKAVGTGTLVLFILTIIVRPYFAYSSIIPVLEGFLAISFMGGARLIIRLLFEHEEALTFPGGERRVLIAGAGDAGIMITRELLRHREAGLCPVGFLDDAPGKQGRRFVGLPVLGRLEDLAKVTRNVRAEEVLIAIPSLPGSVVRRVVNLAQAVGIRYKIIPGVYEILSGKVSVSNIREVDVEDLLRRRPVYLNQDEIASYLENRVILVTGAGGTIGSELVNQSARFRPKKIVLLGKGENSLYHLEKRLDLHWPGLDYVTVLGDVQNRAKLKHIFEQYQPDVVLHSAAFKHVPLMELNPDEAVTNNVIGTRNVVEVALEYETKRFVNISTDKSVNPTSVMGATKRVAEYIVELAANEATVDQVFVSVRFGNVLDSRGSVVPLFRDQISRGGPVTVTHPDMIRYFMTVVEAAQLVLQATSMATNGMVYVLDMGDPVKIADLAADLIRLSGLEPGVDIDIVFTGIRPGEKLFEELLTEEEGIQASYHEKIFIAPNNGISKDHLEPLLQQLVSAVDTRDRDTIQAALAELVPTFHKTEKG